MSTFVSPYNMQMLSPVDALPASSLPPLIRFSDLDKSMMVFLLFPPAESDGFISLLPASTITDLTSSPLRSLFVSSFLPIK